MLGVGDYYLIHTPIEILIYIWAIKIGKNNRLIIIHMS